MKKQKPIRLARQLEVRAESQVAGNTSVFTNAKLQATFNRGMPAKRVIRRVYLTVVRVLGKLIGK